MIKISSEKEDRIKQGTIAQFMRKRTQLVGFEFGYWKHTQYCAEFLDNALDAIESFQWELSKDEDSKFKFTLDQELSLENLTILQSEKLEKDSRPLDEQAKQTLMQEFAIDSREPKELKLKPESSGDTQISESTIDESEIEVEQEVRYIINEMEEIIKPVESIIDIEPLVIIRLREYEAPSFLTSEISQKNVMSYTFEIFDNGTGMSKVDLKKFGRYLASSKSMELKQTRGSQGFGAPSAFSDAQNTTGKPIVAVSNSVDNIYATVSEFFTTSKNEKRYLIHPTEVDCPFMHGTYIKLHYLNVKYVRGYVDTYIKETAFMNPHITIIFIDPYGEEFIYPRKVSSFPKEPKYAKPHPSSTNIGDLQDLLSKSNNLTVSSFLQDNFVRISSKIAKGIIDIAEKDIQDNLNLLILKNGFVDIIQKKSDDIHYLRFEKRVFGRSTKPRDKLIIYNVESEELRSKYYDYISKYNQFNKEIEKVNKNIKKKNNLIEKTETQKDMRAIEKEIKNLVDKIESIQNEKEKIKIELDKLFESAKTELIEQKKLKNRNEFEDLVNQVLIAKAKPAELTNDQFNSLFLAFKSVKYMAPPTDTAIPVGEAVLENTLIKEIGLKVSENLDDVDMPVDNIRQSEDIILDGKTAIILKENKKADKEILKNISVDPEEIINLNNRILSHVDVQDDNLELTQIRESIEEIITYAKEESPKTYQDVFEFFIENYTKDDDFVAAETRAPTSGKGLAYVVEAVLAYSKNLETPKRSRDVLSRFVNRTPKLRDSADCAITKAVQSVNWKNYKLEVYDNNLPKGPIKLLVNVSGPFVHLMFKSQSKNALADDEDLIKEIKYCLEAIGRKLRVYVNRKQAIRKKEKRSSLIEKYISPFVKSIYTIAKEGSRYKDQISINELEDLMKGAIGKKIALPPEPQPEISKLKLVKPLVEEVEITKEPEMKKEVKEEEIEEKEELFEKKESIIEEIEIKTLDKLTIKELRIFAKDKEIEIPSREKKSELINIIKEKMGKKRVEEKPPIKMKEILPVQKEIISIEPVVKTESYIAQEVIKPKNKLPKAKLEKRILPPKPIQTQLPIITTERILNVLSNEWQTIKHLIFKLRIKDMMDARYLQLKLKELERKGTVIVDIKMGKKQWKLK